MRTGVRYTVAGIAVLMYCLAILLPVYGLTTQEVIFLKEKGVSEETIRLMISSEQAQKEQAGTSISITRNESGTTWSTGAPSETPLSRQERDNLERAWEMLRGLRIELEK